MADKQTAMTTAREDRDIARGTRGWVGSPFRVLQRFADEMDRMFDDFGVGWRRGAMPLRSGASELWAPEVDVFQKSDQLIIKADLPGLKKDEVSVEITEDAVIIHGERRSEREDNREGYYRSERSYGSFYRAIPLPEGTITDQAKANFHDGVLEVTMPAPPAATKARRLDITEGAKK
jgi:HSP20 family protein